VPDVSGLVWVDAGVFDHLFWPIRRCQTLWRRGFVSGEQRQQLGAIKKDIEITRTGDLNARDLT
jgi:hypothetical protein